MLHDHTFGPLNSCSFVRKAWHPFPWLNFRCWFCSPNLRRRQNYVYRVMWPEIDLKGLGIFLICKTINEREWRCTFSVKIYFGTKYNHFDLFAKAQYMKHLFFIVWVTIILYYVLINFVAVVFIKFQYSKCGIRALDSKELMSTDQDWE
jgi:hypothetical protein